MYIIRAMGSNGFYVYFDERALMKLVRAAQRFEDKEIAETHRDELNVISVENPNWEVVPEEQAKIEAQR